MIRSNALIALVAPLLTALITGCSGGEDASVSGGANGGSPVSRGANGDCVRAWNAAGNARNRSATSTSNSGWEVTVNEFHVSHPSADLTGRGCSYFFSSPERWRSYGGTWEADGDLRWGTPPTAGGKRTPEQAIESANAVLQSDGKLRRIPTHRGGRLSAREWRAVIDDWYDNGAVDRTHRCVAVREAIRRLPSDIRNYSSASDDLRRYAEVVC